VTLVAFVATPALIMTLILTRSPRKTLLLTMPAPASWLLAAILAVVIHPLGTALGQLVSHLYPLSPTIQAHANNLQAMIGNSSSFLGVMLVLALAPAICEELAFRGFILSGMMNLRGKWKAIIGSAVFFGATHAFVQQSLTACALGIVIGYLAVQTRSLLPGLTFHFVYNSLLLYLGLQELDAHWAARLNWLVEIDNGSVAYRWPAIALSFVGSAAILWCFGQESENTQESLPSPTRPASEAAVSAG
jgi:sodium transport system permease protein